ncbi:MFS transporter [Endozoicomonas euniceicola]|uniref:MFS transporter n=1 Tax=Endozoicomonas euniceicola TaxID=1234143 RepID=A0ABY6GQT9_9GAMM|nr:MFS transporter [Endozoicomonas euniceicola]UYM15110.1 MFS transporter [Endozoicomonas euniceicola]
MVKSNSKTDLSREQLGLIFITSMGGFLELYDFIIYALMAPFIADHFFPGHDPYTSLLTTFATFSIGYLVRPLGGVVFGHLGDRFGRKPIFVATVLIMALSTFLMGCLPTYSQVGIWAPLMLVFLRILQGFSIGGEIPGAMTYLSETVEHRRGLVISLLFAALTNGVLFGSLVNALMLWWLPEESMQEWGWRVPFWLGGTLGICSYMIRKRFQESGLFLQLIKYKARSAVPLVQLLQLHRGELLFGVFLIAPGASALTLLFLFTPGYLTKMLNYPGSDVALAGGIGIFISSLMTIVAGHLADKLPARRLLYAAYGFIVLFSAPVFYWYVAGFDVYWIMLLSGLMVGSLTAALMTLSILFPVNVRYSGIAFCYNAGYALFGGLTPLIAMALIGWSNNLQAPAWYLMTSGSLGLLAAWKLPVFLKTG